MVMLTAGLVAWLSQNCISFPGKDIPRGGREVGRSGKLVPTDAPRASSEPSGGPLNLPFSLEIQM